RRIAIGGSQNMVVWDDLRPEEPLKIYNSGIDVHPADQRSTIMPTYRIGDIYSPRLKADEPLAQIVEQFGRAIIAREPSPIDGYAGLRVVRQLEAAQHSLDESLRRIGDYVPPARQRPAAE